MLDAGFTDNGGAIHSAERILDILGQRLNYPGLNHIRDICEYDGAEFSWEALRAHRRGDKPRIEHVSPTREFTRRAIHALDNGEDSLVEFVRQHYRVVLLTPEEMKHLNRVNRTKMSSDRLGQAGIRVKPERTWVMGELR